MDTQESLIETSEVLQEISRRYEDAANRADSEDVANDAREICDCVEDAHSNIVFAIQHIRESGFESGITDRDPSTTDSGEDVENDVLSQGDAQDSQGDEGAQGDAQDPQDA